MSWPALRHKLPAFLIVLAAGSAVLYSLGLVFDWPDWVHGSNWVWVRRVPEPGLWRNGWLIATFVGWLVILRWVTRQEAWQLWQVKLLLISAVFLTPLMQLLIAAQHRSQPLSVAFLTSASFFQEGVAIENPTAFIQNHTTQMPYYRSVHLQTQPPGWPVAFWTARELWELFPKTAESVGRWFRRYDCLATDLQGLTPAQLAAATLQMSILLVSGFGVLPLYGLGKDLFSEQVARTAVWLYPFLPGFLVFQARFDVLYAVVALFALWLVHRSMRFTIYDLRFTIYDLRFTIALCFLLTAMTFFAFSVFAIVGMVEAYLLVYVLLQRPKFQFGAHGDKHVSNMFIALARQFIGWVRPFLVFNLFFSGCLALLWGGFWLWWGASWPKMFQISREIHEMIRINYPLWPLFNLYDFGVFLGLPLLVMALAGGVGAVISDQWSVISGSPERVFVLGWLLSLVVLNLSGQVRAETGRLWLFLAPPALLIGAAAMYAIQTPPFPLPPSPLPSPPSPFPLRLSSFILLTFALQSLTTGYFLGGRVPPTTVPEPQWSVPDSATAVSYQLGEAFRLQGHEIEEETNQLALTLYWQTGNWPLGDYSVFVHLEQNGQTTAQSDGTPMGGTLPTWCWVSGEVVADKHVLAWDGKRPYSILIGLYDWRTGERLPVQPAVPDHAIPLVSK